MRAGSGLLYGLVCNKIKSEIVTRTSYKCQGSDKPCGEKVTFFLISSWTTFSCFNLCPLLLIFPPCLTVKSLALPSQYHPCRYGWAAVRVPGPSLLQAEQTPVPQSALPHRTSAPAPPHPGSPSLHLLLFVAFLVWGTQNQAQYSSSSVTSPE